MDKSIGHNVKILLNKMQNYVKIAAQCELLKECTRKPCYCKDDRAMRPTYRCPEKLRESLATSTATFPEIVNGLLLQSIVLKCVQNLKFVASPVPAIIGVPKKFRQSLDTPTLPFLQNFNGLLLEWTLWMYLPNLKSVALPVPEIIGGTLKLWTAPGYAVLGHPRSLILVPIESVYATSY